MTWRTWCRVMLVVAVVATTSAGTWQARPYPIRRDCIPFPVSVPFHYFIARSERAVKQEVEDVECGKDGNTTDCHPDSDTTPDMEAVTANISANGENLLPKSNECGLRSRKSYRIYHGEDAPLSAYPWIALFGYKDPCNPKWLCGGTLINERYVVSAAHCVHPSYTRLPTVGQLVKIRLGEHNLETDPDCPEAATASVPCAPSPQDLSPEHVMFHENYDNEKLINDISLIRLDRPVIMGSSVRPVCLPPADLDVKEFLGSRDAVVAGWGTTENEKCSKILQRAPIPYADKTTCEKLYFRPLKDTQMCFGGRGKVDSCYGDSGGPIMQAKNGTSRYTLLGIVSFGKSVCGIPGTPAIYTNVASYRDWIVQNIMP